LRGNGAAGSAAFGTRCPRAVLGSASVKLYGVVRVSCIARRRAALENARRAPDCANRSRKFRYRVAPMPLRTWHALALALLLASAATSACNDGGACDPGELCECSGGTECYLACDGDNCAQHCSSMPRCGGV